MEKGDPTRGLAQGLDAFVASAKAALGDDLVSIVLFGAAAEGDLRAAASVNLLVVLSRFDPGCIDRLREPLRVARAAIRLEAMLILESELHEAAEAFSVKFADILARHRLLAGRDVMAAIAPSRGAMLTRLRQILLNYVLRSRERYALMSLKEEQAAVAVADSASALRAAAEMMLQLEGRPARSPREALEMLARELDPDEWTGALARLSAAQDARLAPGEGARTVLQLLSLAQRLRERAAKLA